MEIGQLIILIISMGGFFLWNRLEARTDNRRALDLIESIKTEMQDFHGRLTKQDAEFKAAILLLEEKYKQKTCA